jgi:hypothetical protein
MRGADDPPRLAIVRILFFLERAVFSFPNGKFLRN